MIMDASFEITDSFTTLSAPMLHDWGSHTGTLSLGFCLTAVLNP